MSAVDESTGEEREFELSNAMADLETADERAERRERDARAALADEEEEERVDRGLETVKTDGPGPKDKGKGAASKKQVRDHGLDVNKH